MIMVLIVDMYVVLRCMFLLALASITWSSCVVPLFTLALASITWSSCVVPLLTDKL